ncbi:MAG: transglutaminase-like cysteine peptidase [Candidatus Dormibacteraceae bacterium]
MKRSVIVGIMMMVFGGVFAPSAADALALASPEGDLLPLAKSMPESHVAAPLPSGFVSFCIRFADQCATVTTEPASVTLTPAVWEELQSINDQVNHALTPVDDLAHYGIAEYWTIPTDGKGDCEDYALMKRKELIAAGIPARALRIAVVRTAKSEGHAVLTVATDHGDFVLDNLAQTVLSWDNTGYRWIERQDPNDGWAWVTLSPVQSEPLVAAMPVGGATPGH